MGMYDTIIGSCPFCKKEYRSQTKLTCCELRDFRCGDLLVGLGVEIKDCHLQLKNKCWCGKRPVAVIKNGRFQSLIKKTSPKDIREGLWGSILKGNESVDSQANKDFQDSFPELEIKAVTPDKAVKTRKRKGQTSLR
jgi:hypothetical protein